MNAPLDPNQTFDYVMPDHESLPADQRPVLRFRYMSCREWMAFETRWEQCDKGELTPPQIVSMLAIGFVGVSINGGSFGSDIDSLLDAYSPAGLVWLCQQLPTAALLSEIDRKKSARQSPSSSAGSAANVPATSA